MEEEIEQIQQLLFEEPKNTLKTFGVSKEILLLANPYVLREFFKGINNFRMPRGVWEHFNPDEGLSVYFGVGDIKRDLLNEAPQEFPKLISYLNKKAWSNNNFAWLSHKFEHPFSRIPGAQQKRLEKIASEDINKFLTDFFQEPYNGNYYDPNKNPYGNIDKDLYVVPVYRHIKSIYKP